MKILLLGGTSDARRIAGGLIEQGQEVVYSVAGLVRLPTLACAVISGGFSQRGGLTNYLKQEQFAAVVDATHPYALKMSATADSSCEQLALPYYRFDRPAWPRRESWLEFTQMSAMLAALHDVQSALLTTGQLSQGELDLVSQRCQRVIYRTAAAPSATLRDNVTWIKAVGPFDLEAEKALMRTYKIDTLLTKNAGGEATCAKLEAADLLAVQVLMLQRPSAALSHHSQCYQQIDTLLAQLRRQSEM